MVKLIEKLKLNIKQITASYSINDIVGRLGNKF